MIAIPAAFLGFLALGLPIAFVIGIAGDASGFFNLHLRPMLIPERMFNGVDQFHAACGAVLHSGRRVDGAVGHHRTSGQAVDAGLPAIFAAVRRSVA